MNRAGSPLVWAAWAVALLVGSLAQAQTITVTAPTAGDTWFTGQTHTITWSKTGPQHALVGIHLRGGVGTTATLSITDSAPNSGAFSWTVPTHLEPGQYTLGVRTVDGQVTGSSSFALQSFQLAGVRTGDLRPMPLSPVSLKVCVTNGKRAPINRDRDIHVWIKNLGGRPVRDLTLNFFVEGKGTSTHPIQELIPLAEHSQTRRHSWSTGGRRKLTAQLLVPGGETILVNGNIHIQSIGSTTYQLELNLICSDGSMMRESDIPGLPKPEEDPLDLLVCASDGKNPPVYGERDIHV